MERHADLIRVLVLPEFAADIAYASFERDELPEGLSNDDVVKTG